MPVPVPALVIAIAIAAALIAIPAHAEPPADAGPPTDADPTHPPRLVAMPNVVVPSDVALPPEGRVELVLRIATDGSAEIELCGASEAVCTLIRDALPHATIEPALRDGTKVAARVRVALRLAQPAPAPAPATQTPAPATPNAQRPAGTAPGGKPRPAAEPAPALAPGTPEFSATAHVYKAQPGVRRLELAEMRDLPGALGDPFRAVDALPGVTPALSGLPYFYVRGSPPASTLNIYDDIPVPTLYHLGVLGAVIHPRMVGPIRLYSGVAPARYGRLTGGVVVGEGPEAPDGRFHAEAELRLLDVSAYVQAPALGGNVTAAVRYGYPALLLSIFSPEVSLAYWDYQLRYNTQLSSRDRFELVALGSYDSLSAKDEPDTDTRIAFHRIEPRLIRRMGSTEYGVALLLGWEQSAFGAGFRLQATRVAPRAWVEHRWTDKARLRISGDLIGVAGFFTSQLSDEGPQRNNENRGRTVFGDLPARSLWGLQAELGLRPVHAFELQLGARADAWIQGAGVESVIDPRARAIWHAGDALDLHVAGGVVHQPAVFYIPLPGIADVALDRGLQSAIQTEAGVGWDTPLELRIELQGFLHYYQNLVFVDTLFLQDSFDKICGNSSNRIDCTGLVLPSRIDGYSYGAELFVRRPVSERLSGWVSYTLAWSQVDDVAGMTYTPTWDARHVGNLVLQWNMGAGFSSGARLMFRSGKTHGEFLIDDRLQLNRDERRLPWFMRLDLELAYAWHPDWGRMRVSLEWFNATLAKEPFDLECVGEPRVCRVIYLPAIFFPNLGVRGEI